MAAFDANLGSFNANLPASPYSNNTTAAAAANSRIVVLISYWTATASPKTITGVTIGGSAATADLKVLNANGNDRFEIWSRPFAAGLSSGSAVAITVTSSPADGGVLVGVLSITGVDMTVGGGVAGTGSSSNQSGTNWTSGTSSAAGGLAVGGAGNETTLTSETATATTGTLLHHAWNSAAQQGFATAYIVGTSVSGTFANTSSATTGGIVGYTDAVAPSQPIRRMPLSL